MKRTLIIWICLLVASLPLSAFTNPILPYDFSDPDAIRVGKDYYMTYSTFACTPALQILHSRDMVNWKIVDAAMPDTVPGYGRVDACPAGCGVWAPSIRYQGGRFYIYYGDPDQGIFCVRSERTKALPCRWEQAVMVKAGKGLIDPCPLWDSDGRVYLVHAYAGSRAGFKSALAVCELSSDGLSVISEDRLVFDAHDENPTCEGPKLYKRNGWYYIMCPAGGVSTGWQLCLRSRSVYGPYEWRRVLEQGSMPVNAPHQGAWVDNWFIHFQDVGIAGRIIHLQPLRWQDDWPWMGNNGEPMTEVGAEGIEQKENKLSRDDFNGPILSPEWQWSGNRKARYSFFLTPLTTHESVTPNALRLFTYPCDEILTASNLLLRKIPANTGFTFTARVRFRPNPRTADHEQAGVIVHGRQCRPLAAPSDGQWWYLRIVANEQYVCRFYLSKDGVQWTEQGEPFQAIEGVWIGAKVGFYAIRDRVSINDSGYMDVDWATLEQD